MKYWLFKSEPDTFSIDALGRSPQRTTRWDGVRNYQVRNMMRDEMSKGDLGFFYHSSCAVPVIAGVVKVVGEARPDPTAFDRKSEYFDAGSDAGNPRWLAVDVQLVRKFAQPVTLTALKEHAAGKLQGMQVLRRGNRLSITPVSKSEWDFIIKLAGD